MHDYDEILNYRYFRNTRTCGCLTTVIPRLFVTSNGEGPLIKRPLIKLCSRQAPSSQQVAEALQPLTLSLCPHWSMNDPFVLLRYSPNCEKLYSSFRPFGPLNCKCEGCLWRRRDCPSCGASVSFHISGDYDRGHSALEVMVQRKGFQIRSITDPVWIKHHLIHPNSRNWNRLGMIALGAPYRRLRLEIDIIPSLQILVSSTLTPCFHDQHQQDPYGQIGGRIT